MLSEQAAIERRSAHRTATQGRVFGLAMEIWNQVAIDELQCGVFLKEAHHAWAVREEGARTGFVKLFAQFMA